MTGVAPNSAILGTQNLDVAVSGMDFANGDQVAFSGTGITVNSTTYVSPTELDANISIAPDAIAGMRDITVANMTLGSGTCVSCFMIAPIVNGVAPGSYGQGASAQNITITGDGFENGAYTSVSGTGVSVNWTSFVSPTQLIANVNVASNATLGAHDVVVTDPGQGVGTCSGCFSVNAAPTVTSTSPSSRGQGASANITVNGSGFVNGASATVGGTGVTVNSTTYVSPTKLTLAISTTNAAPIGARSVTVTNPDMGVGSCAACFTINKGPTVTDWNVLSGGYYFQLLIDSILRQQYTTNVEVDGSNFQSGAVVTYSAPANEIRVNSTTFVSSSKIKMNITVDVSLYEQALPQDRAVTVTNPDGGTYTCQGCVVLLI